MSEGRDTLLTVAVPTFNGASHLRATLQSILVQSVDADFDLILCDDRSDDDTVAVAAAACGDRARVCVHTERLGLAGNWNRCVDLARSPLVAIVHQDDILRNGHLASHLQAYRRSPDRLGLIASAVAMIDENDRELPRSIVDPGGLGPVDREFLPGELVRPLVCGNLLRCSAVTIVKAAHGAVGGFNPALKYVVDWDFWLRVGQDWGASWLAADTVAMRWHEASETHRFKAGTLDLDESAQLFEQVMSRHCLAWPDIDRIRQTRRKALARAFLNRAYDAARFDSALARKCLARALRLRPALAATIALDPRLTARLAAAMFRTKRES